MSAKRKEDLKKADESYDSYVATAIAGFLLGAYCFYRYSLWTRTGA